MSDTTTEVAYEARNLARQAARDIEQHEDVCAERYAGIHKAIDEIKGILKWAGGAAFTIIIGLLAFLAKAQFNANDAASHAAESKIEMLQQQRSDRPPEIVIQRVPATPSNP